VLLKPHHARFKTRYTAMKEITIPTDALARFRAAASEFTGDAKRRASRLEAVRDDIAAMRAKGASFRTISEMLSRCGIRASDTCVMRFCRRGLGEQPVRVARPKSRAAVHKNGSAAPKAAPVATDKAALATTVSEAAQVALLDDLLNCPLLEAAKPPASGGPRIAKIKFANPNEL
jgi:hypothetical protein